MKRAEYVSQNEMEDIYILGGIQDGMDKLISTTKEKDWLRKLRTCSTYLTQLINERLAVIPDPKELLKLKRRIDSCKLYWSTKDGVADFSPPDVIKYIIPEDELFVICDCAVDNKCKGCTGDFHKCSLRNAFHASGIPTMVGNPEGKCEYWVEGVEK